MPRGRSVPESSSRHRLLLVDGNRDVWRAWKHISGISPYEKRKAGLCEPLTRGTSLPLPTPAGGSDRITGMARNSEPSGQLWACVLSVARARTAVFPRASLAGSPSSAASLLRNTVDERSDAAPARTKVSESELKGESRAAVGAAEGHATRVASTRPGKERPHSAYTRTVCRRPASGEPRPEYKTST